MGWRERGDGRKQKVDNDGSEVAVDMILAHRERVVSSGIQLNGWRFSLVDFLLRRLWERVDEGRESRRNKQTTDDGELREGRVSAQVCVWSVVSGE